MLALSVYVTTAKGYLEISDTTFSMTTAQALIHSGTLAIKNEEGVTLAGPDGQNYSKYGIGLPLLFLPCVVVGDLAARMTGLPADNLANFLASFLNCFFGAAACSLVYLVVCHFGGNATTGVITAVAFGFGTLAWRYSVCDFSEVAQMYCLLGAVYGVLKRSPASLLAGSFCFGFLLLLKLVYIVYLPLFGLYLIAALWKQRKATIQSLLIFTSFIIPAGIFLLILNHERFGSIWESGYGDQASQFYWGQIISTIPQLLFSLGKGLFVFSPVLLIAVLGFVGFAIRFRQEALFFVTIIITNLLLASAWHWWGGGWSWGPRLLVPVIPFWIIPLSFVLAAQERRYDVLLYFLIAASIILQVAGVVVKDQQLHHLRITLRDPEHRTQLYPDSIAAWVLLKHKLTVGNERYLASELGASSDQVIDVSDTETFTSLNLWSYHLSRQFGHPWLKYIPLSLIPLMFSAAFALYRQRTIYLANGNL